jgi:hypothetical protein
MFSGFKSRNHKTRPRSTPPAKAQRHRNSSMLFESLEQRLCQTAVPDTATLSANTKEAPFVVVNVLANDTGMFPAIAELKTIDGQTTPLQTSNRDNNAHVECVRDNTGAIKALKYSLPSPTVTIGDYNAACAAASGGISEWADQERKEIGRYYDAVRTTIVRLAEFLEDSAAKLEFCGSLADLAGDLAGASGASGGGAAGKVVQLFFDACKNKQCRTFQDAVNVANQKSFDDEKIQEDKVNSKAKELQKNLQDLMKGQLPKTYTDDTFKYVGSEFRRTSKPVPGVSSGSIFSQATVTINMRFDDYRAITQQVTDWKKNNLDGLGHLINGDLNLDTVYGDTLLAFANRAGAGVTWDANGQRWQGISKASGVLVTFYMPVYPYSGQYYGIPFSIGGYLEPSTCSGFDIADELNKFGYKPKSK